ncbi:MAG TPA: type II toxin-antitoxin system VapC family toxin [Herpetosiphonaceae bacterium]|jgi:tRNA(fMet)-specific endonuclease VapC|nr:type II toxin-antitoxin system VapC family toxin [Herpetosiphonaceae bacterium]
MIRLLDTNICIYLIKRQPPEVLQRFTAYTPGDLGVSTVTAAELWYGAAKSGRPAQNRQALDQFLLPLVIAPFDDSAARAYGRLRADLERQGTPIGALDTLIAAHALSLGVPLVTNNVKEFARVAGLPVENWAEPAG